jgi:hypothetical protein
MRLLEMLVNATALACGLGVLAFFTILVAVFEFLGVFITGVAVLLISYTVEMEDGSAIGHAQSTDLYAMQLGQPKSPDEWAAGRTERSERLSVLKIFKLIGAALVAIGGLGFYFVQL